jgi:hypothetical protein
MVAIPPLPTLSNLAALTVWGKIAGYAPSKGQESIHKACTCYPRSPSQAVSAGTALE